MKIFVILCSIIAGSLLVLFSHLLVNLLTFPRLKTRTMRNTPGDPLVSLLVPARNEETHIRMCVNSLLNQDYPHLEILVLDDCSDDATAEIVQNIIDSLPPDRKGRLRLFHGQQLPPGWIGKNFACYQLSRHAQGTYLFFTDADTVHAPTTVRVVIDYMQQLHVDLLTAQPAYKLTNPATRLIVPLLYFRLFTLLPLTLVNRRPEALLAAGNGPLLCFKRQAYKATGGHQAIKEHILEDVTLARSTKAAGFSLAFLDAQDFIVCSTYPSFRATLAGFSKTFFAFYNYSLLFSCLIIIFDCILFLIPVLFILSSFFTHISLTALLLAWSSYGLAVLMRLFLAFRFARAQKLLMLLLCFLHPLTIVLGWLILFNSIRWHYRRRGTAWKGRYYLTRQRKTRC